MPVKGNGQNSGYRRKKDGNVVSADIVGFKIDSGEEQKNDDENACNEHRVADGEFEFPTEENAGFVSDYRKDDSEKRRVQDFTHGVSFFRNVQPKTR